jgi:hypothetical protein
MTIGIPPAIDTDVEDVVWALQTAASLWTRNERVDAIVWLRRAAQAAGDAQHDERALVLARDAAELSDWIAKNPLPPPSNAAPVPSSIPPNDSVTGGVDDLLKDIPIEAAPAVSLSAPTAPFAFMPVNLPAVVAPPLAPPPPVAPPPPAPVIPMAPATSDLIPISESSSPVVFQSVALDRTSENVQSAAEAHAGLLDPWATPTEEDLPSAAATPNSSIVSSEDDEEDVVTSARLVLPPAEPAMVMAAPPLPAAKPPAPKPPPRAYASAAAGSMLSL